MAGEGRGEGGEGAKGVRRPLQAKRKNPRWPSPGKEDPRVFRGELAFWGLLPALV